MSTDDDLAERQPYRSRSGDMPSNTELSERITRVEEGIGHVETKIDHQGQTLERIADNLDNQTNENAAQIQEMGDEHDRLWYIYQGTKWLLMLICGGSLSVFIITAFTTLL